MPAAEFLTIPMDSWAGLGAMALVTYLTRIGGFFLMGRVSLTPRVRTWLEALPGCMLVALTAPVVLTSGPAEAMAGAAALGTAWKTKSLPAALVVGVGTVWMLRRLLGA